MFCDTLCLHPLGRDTSPLIQHLQSFSSQPASALEGISFNSVYRKSGVLAVGFSVTEALRTAKLNKQLCRRASLQARKTQTNPSLMDYLSALVFFCFLDTLALLFLTVFSFLHQAASNEPLGLYIKGARLLGDTGIQIQPVSSPLLHFRPSFFLWYFTGWPFICAFACISEPSCISRSTQILNKISSHTV